MRTQNTQKIRYATKALALGCLVVLAGGCADSTIHKKSTIADVETLSLDAKQRLVFVADRQAGAHERVMCTEPMPDALVARAAVLAAGGNFAQGGTTAAAQLAAGSSEAAANIGFRDETVQMLRDGYYRLCEAYMNGALTTRQYQEMILNADTFMVVISALQTLGTNPVTPAVAISAGGVSATLPKDGTASASITTGADNLKIANAPDGKAPAAKDKSAEMAAQIVKAYLQYRWMLARENAKREARHPTPERKSY